MFAAQVNLNGSEIRDWRLSGCAYRRLWWPEGLSGGRQAVQLATANQVMTVSV